jgi:hypothetical protein
LKPVQINGKWGYANESGKFIIQPQYPAVGDFSEGYASVKVKSRSLISSKWGFIDKSSTMIIQPQYYSVDDFVNGRARISIGELCNVGSRGDICKGEIF